MLKRLFRGESDDIQSKNRITDRAYDGVLLSGAFTDPWGRPQRGMSPRLYITDILSSVMFYSQTARHSVPLLLSHMLIGFWTMATQLLSARHYGRLFNSI